MLSLHSIRPLPGMIGLLCLLPSLVTTASRAAETNEWSVAVAGNAYRTAPNPSRRGIRRDGTLALREAGEVYSVFFRVDRAATIELQLTARASSGEAPLTVNVDGEDFDVRVTGQKFASHKICQVNIATEGYVRVDIRGGQTDGAVDAEIRSLEIGSETEDLTVDFVRTNDGNMFYWGRRGPSVHLRYEVPKDRPLQYAYSELTVPEGEDPLGSYYMANGFGEGYFGIQVNGPDERRVLFSVWSPFKTDNPRDIPEEQRIVALAKGAGVHVGEFGNEGSGGQSYLVYPWKSGTTYRFLTEVRPDGKGNTIYTSWFGDKAADTWRLIASFRRPRTDTHLRGFHAFLESFNPTYGHIGRRADYGNVWVRDTDGKWHECTQARFSVDATGRGRYRLDFTGGSQGDTFFLRNCGFFDHPGHPGDTFTRKSTADEQPKIQPGSLPKG